MFRSHDEADYDRIHRAMVYTIPFHHMFRQRQWQNSVIVASHDKVIDPHQQGAVAARF